MLVINLQAQAGVKLKEKFKVSEKDLIDLIVKKGQLAEEKSYTVYMEECAEKGYTLAQGISIPLDLRSFVSNLEEDKILFQKIEGKKDVLIWNEEAEYFEWSFEVPQEGLYEISMEYYPLDGSGNPIQRSIMIDGEIPFIEAHNIQFYRIWNDKEEPRVNNVGDEVRPRQVEKREWQTVSLTDHQGMYSEPFRFYFTRGKHTMRLIFMEEPMAIGGITIKSPERIPAYEELLNEYEKKSYKNASQTVRFEAENSVIRKSDTTIRRESDGDPLTCPKSTTTRKLNIMGGSLWRRGNMSITWKFSVPEDGLYKIGMREAQWYQGGMPVYRQIAIDGKVPFAEMMEYEFEYDKDWRMEVLSNKNGEPYLFYLSKGEHEITTTVKMGPLREIIESLNADMLLLSEVIRDIIMLTGTEPDLNYEYELEKTFLTCLII